MYEFEKWEPGEPVPYPAITIFPSGLINFEKEVAKSLGVWEAESASLYFDTRKGRIGIRLFQRLRSGHVSVRRHLKSASIKSRRFTSYWGLSFPGKRRLVCYYDQKQKMVVIETQRPVPPGRRTGE